MTIQIDSREKPQAIGKILRFFDDNNIKHFVSKLPCGDYMSLDNARLCIDRKQNLQEICGNVTQQHKRFVAELMRASDLEIQLIILCEHGSGIECLEDVRGWENPRLRLSPGATTGECLCKVMHTMELRHGVRFLFCKKAETGRRIAELLAGQGASTSWETSNSTAKTSI